MESECISLTTINKEVKWLRNMLLDIKLWLQSIPSSRSCNNLADPLTEGLSRDLVRSTSTSMGFRPH